MGPHCLLQEQLYLLTFPTVASILWRGALLRNFSDNFTVHVYLILIKQSLNFEGTVQLYLS
jgi:hypothetical protein